MQGAGRSLNPASGGLEGVLAVEGGAGPSQPPRPGATETLLGGLAREIVKYPGARDVEYVMWQIFHYPTLLHTAVCSPQMALCRWRDPMGGGCPPSRGPGGLPHSA